MKIIVLIYWLIGIFFLFFISRNNNGGNVT